MKKDNKHKSPEGKIKLLEIKNRMNTKNPKKLAISVSAALANTNEMRNFEAISRKPLD